MKYLILAILLIESSHAYSGVRIVDEDTLVSWGYKTISIEESQLIKKIEKINKEGPAYYPRFYISKKCFENDELALKEKERIEELQRTDIKHRNFDYRKGFVHKNCLFILDTNAVMFTYEHQPKVFELLRSYIENKNHNRLNQTP